MLPHRHALAIAFALSAAACGGAAPAFPDESTFHLEAPDDEATSPLCADGDDAYRGEGRLRRIIDELNEAAQEHLVTLRAARRAAVLATRRDGRFERRFEGPRGTATWAAAEQEDGTVTWTVSVGAKGQQEFELIDGSVAADGLSGTWALHNRGGLLVRTITWSRPAADSTDLAATWKNEVNGRVAAFERIGTSATLAVSGPMGTIDFAWDTETKAGSAIVKNAAGETVRTECWDGEQCNVACPAG